MTKLSEKLQDYQLALGLTFAGILVALIIYATVAFSFLRNHSTCFYH